MQIFKNADKIGFFIKIDGKNIAKKNIYFL